MSKTRLFPLIALCTVGLLGSVVGGCHAEAKIGNPEPKVAPPPPPPPAPPPPAPEPKPVALKSFGKARIVNNEIQIPGKIQFDLDKATIKENKETTEILDTLQKVMTDNPQITKVRIEGHTDDKGTLEHNQKLSQERADSVMAWLAGKGVDKARMTTVGFGPSKPQVPNDNDAHREQNRRTEFKIWEMDGKPTDAAKADAANPPAATPTTAGNTTTVAKPGATPAKPATPATPAAKH